jgi:hypothetical protein
LTHSEFNLAQDPVNFYQIWIFPDFSGLEPTYDQKTFSPSQWKNKIFPVASGQNIPGTVSFHTDATIYRCDIDKDQSLVFEAVKGRRIFIYLTSGELLIDGQIIEQKDQARIDSDVPLRIKAISNADFILIDLPSCKGWGYSQETLRGSKK